MPTPPPATGGPVDSRQQIELARAIQSYRAIWLLGLAFAMLAAVAGPALWPDTVDSVLDRLLIGCITFQFVSSAVELAIVPAVRLQKRALRFSTAGSFFFLVSLVSSNVVLAVAAMIATGALLAMSVVALSAYRRSLKQG